MSRVRLSRTLCSEWLYKSFCSILNGSRGVLGQARKKASKQASKQAGEQAGKQANKQVSRQAGEQAGKQAGKQASKQASTKRVFSRSHALEGLVIIDSFLVQAA